MLEGSRAVLEYREFQDAARSIFDSCKKLIGATGGYIAILSEGGAENEVLFLDSGGLGCTVDESLPMPIRGLREQVYRSGKAAYHNGFSQSEWAHFLPDGHVSIENVLFAPLLVDGNTGGLLGLANKPGGFNGNDARMASAFGELAAIALRNSRTLEAMESREQHFRSVTQSASDGIISANTSGQIVYWNEAAERMFGYSADAVIGKPLTLIMPKRFRQDHQKGIKRVVSTGQSRVLGHTVELVGLRDDGSEFPVELSLSSWKTKEGTFLTGILRDITERKQAEEKIKNLARFPSENPHPVLRISADGTVLYANAVAELLLDSRGSGVGKVLPAEWNEVNTNTFGTNSKQQTDIQHDERIFSFEVVPVSGTEYVNWYGRDITERKRAEDEKHKWEEKMQQAQKLESLGVLAGGIAHDFNNLLTGVLGVADQAAHEVPSTSPLHQHFEMIQKSARRAAALCQQMLAYSGKGHFTVQTFSLDKLVEDMMGLLEMSISKDVVLKCNYAHNVPPIEADVNQVRQVVMNLVTNASEAIGDNSGVVRVSTGVMEADKDYLTTTFLDDDLPQGSYVYVEVADTGCGMDRETMGKIFDPFFTTKFTGRGLGLAAMLGIVRGHCGAVKVDSRPGQGTTIRMLLPASGKQAKPLDVKSPKADLCQGEGTILMIDDEEIMREAVKLLFSGSGFTLLTAQDGHEGVEAFRRCSDEVVAILLDMTMPHMSGKETFAELRRIQPDVKVILISGYAEEEAKSRFNAEGLLGFLQKPFVRAQLMTALEEALNA